ncbi:MAG: hypothetical protein WCJ39_08775 [bacterium]
MCVGTISCTKENDNTSVPAQKACPTTSSNVSLTAGTIGQWTVGHEGNDGYSSDGVNLQSSCGWTINGTESGGYGNTYAVKVNSAASEVMRWAGNKFVGYELRAGWTGATEKGFHIGDSVYKFRAVYDTINFYKLAPYTNVYALKVPTGNPAVSIYFASEFGALEEIHVSLPY